ncbi:MAG: DUF4282 domain-containing protein [Sulfurimonas sp.]|jgi:hypothetical protein
MWDILSFNNFIAQNVLIVFYYLGALGVPLILYYYKDKTVKYLDTKGLHISLDTKEEKIALLILVVIFLCAELCWRMVFEAMIGYFDMHDYLHEILKKLS